jgi:radical SAM enzyme (TIGR01210 family)
MGRPNSVVLERRGPKRALDPFRAYGAFVEDEADGSGGTVPVATILLTNRECPWRCVFCDLWQNTLDETVPAGAIEAQIRAALADLPPARWIKLYNAGSFFDPRAIPPDDHPGIAAALAGFERVIVECHPALVGDGALRLRDLLRARLEVAMGLEIANASVLARLEKGMTLEDFARAANVLQRGGIDLRAFILVQPPFVAPADAVEEAARSLAFAQDCGASVCSLIPTRPGPRLETLEAAFDEGLARARSRVFADLWELERFSDCARCFPARRDRLARQNRTQRLEARVACDACHT